ncbi:MAG: DUF2953 domain-containing protein [Lachnospiraceae bacterium]|nr:DUF2953 domain-containing protein [Lachnospiraceae bacterium]
MIPVLLTILKIIGILLLVLLVLLAALLLSVLFVPVRYRLQAVHTDEETCGELRATWLLHLLSVRMALKAVPEASDDDVSKRNTSKSDRFKGNSSKSNSSGDSAADAHTQMEMPSLPQIEKELQISIFGISLARIQEFFKKSRNQKAESGKTEKRKTEKRKTGKRRTEKRKTGKGKKGKRRTEKRKKDKYKTDTDKGKEQKRGTDTREKNTGQTNVSIKNIGEKSTEHQRLEYRNTEHPDTEHQNSDHQKEASWSGEAFRAGDSSFGKQAADHREEGKRKARARRFLHKWRELCERIKNIPNQAARLYRKIRALLAKPGEMLEKASKLYRKLQKYEAAEVLKECRDQIQVLFTHFRVRKGTGFLRFGTGDPALTGELTGVLYLLMPVGCGEISIEPQFTERMLELNLSVRGHIRLIHLVRTIWWGVRNQRLRRLIRAFRRG